MEKKIETGKMLAFYKEKNIAPVSQIITDLSKHFHRRSTLYKQMGISPSDFSGKKVIEIGPGTGQNSLHIASLKPAIITLVEPNPTGVKGITELFDKYPSEQKYVSLEYSSIEEFSSEFKYDLVLCEGLIGASGHPDPAQLVSSIAKHVSPGGTIVLTSIDYPAYLAEMLRRLIGHEMTRDIKDFESKVDLICDVFEPHLRFLPGMSRNSRDWAIDNLINPASVSHLVTFPGLVEILSDLGFSVSGTSPRFIADWAWYKDAALELDFFNRSALRSYWVNAHGFIDYKNTYSPRSEESNKQLEGMCKKIHLAISVYEVSNDQTLRSSILDDIVELSESLKTDMPFVYDALKEVLLWISETSIDPDKIKKSTGFGSWFGRSQTYVAFTLGK